MFRIIDIYITSRVVRSLAISALFLIMFVAILTMISELSLRGADAFTYIALGFIPFIIYDILPLACVIGVVIAVQSMINKNELVIIKELGMGRARVIFLVSFIAFIAGIFAYLWADFVAVPLHKISHKDSQQQSTSVRGVWLLSADDQLIYVDTMELASPTSEDAAGAIAKGNIRTFEFNGEELSSYRRGLDIKFQEGDVAVAAKSLNWQDGLLQLLADSPYPLKLDPQKLIDSQQNVRSQNVFELWRGGSLAQELGISSKARSYEIWDRVSKPVLFVALALLMLAFCLSIPPRSPMILLVIIAIAIGIVTGTIFKSLTLYAAVANADYLWLGALGPPIVMSCLSVAFIWRRL